MVYDSISEDSWFDFFETFLPFIPYKYIRPKFLEYLNDCIIENYMIL